MVRIPPKKATPEQKVLNFLASNLLWNGKKRVLTLQEPFDILLQTSATKDWLAIFNPNQVGFFLFLEIVFPPKKIVF